MLGASNRPWDIDEAIQRRLSRSFKVGLPSFNQRVQILKVILWPDPAADVSMDDINEIATRTDKCVVSQPSACLTCPRCSARNAVRCCRKDALRSCSPYACPELSNLAVPPVSKSGLSYAH